LSSQLFANILPVDAIDDIRGGMVLDDIMKLVVLRVVAVPCLLVNWIWLVMLLGVPVAIGYHTYLQLYHLRNIQATCILINIYVHKDITSDISLRAKANVRQQLIEIKPLRNEHVYRNETLKGRNTKCQKVCQM